METLDIKTKQTLVRRTIWICWFALIGCFIVKLFGGNYFEIIADNETFIKFCEFLESYQIHNVIKCIFYCFNIGLLISIFSRSELRSIKLKLLIIFISLISWIIKRNFALFGATLETIIFFTLPLFISKEKKIKTLIYSILGCLFVNVLQLISFFVKSIDSMIIQENFIIGLIFQIDYYIMLILYYLYYVKMKGSEIMDWGVFWLADSKAMDKGYTRFIKVMSTIGMVLTFPVSVPYILWKKHKANKMVKVKD